MKCVCWVLALARVSGAVEVLQDCMEEYNRSANGVKAEILEAV